MRSRLIMLLLSAVCFGTASAPAFGQMRKPASELYDKSEYRIPMRDGVELHTTVYRPKADIQPLPIVLKRTPYSCRPYGPGVFPRTVGPPLMQDDGYIFVQQDVRGRWMSDGDYDNMRPHVPGDSAIDESSDTYDTIEWLLNNIEGHNGRVGMYGISYPGFYSAAALPEAHPALVAVSPQAPIADFFFDDFHHQGAYTLMYWQATSTFGYQNETPTSELWYNSVRPPTRDAYSFYLSLGPLAEGSRSYYGEDNFFWQQLVEHATYDEFWRKRNLLPHLKEVRPNVMTVGGWFDAEDLYGPLNIYRNIEQHNPDTFNIIVMGPWSHGDWSRQIVRNQVSEIIFGENLSEFFQREIEAPFFRHFLKDEGEAPTFEALMFDTGSRDWRVFEQWPPTDAEETVLYFGDGSLSRSAPSDSGDATADRFVSDPQNPVPYRHPDDLKIRFTPRPYMADDQSFAGERDDVLVYQTEVLDEDFTLAGELRAELFVTSDQTDADWVVKLIDVYPDDTPADPRNPSVELGGYQQMVRSEVFRSRFRNGYDKAVPLTPGEVTAVTVPLQDVMHTFRKGHRLMVQVQSSWFPLIDRNPQKFVPNVFKARAEDYVKANHAVMRNAEHASRIVVRQLTP